MKSNYHRCTTFLSTSFSPKKIHVSAITSSISEPLNCISSNTLDPMYSNFTDLNTANLFDTVSWNRNIKTLVDSGNSEEALFLFRKMRNSGVFLDGFTFPLINRAIISLNADVVYGNMVHCVAVKLGFGSDLYFCNTVIEVYSKSGYTIFARKLFDEMPERDLVSYTSMISVYAREGNLSNAFNLFNESLFRQMEPSYVTIIVLLHGCSLCRTLNQGKQIHGYVIKNGVLTYGSVQNSILRMYTRAGSVKEVETFFNQTDQTDIDSWNTLISYYSLSSCNVDQVINRFQRLINGDDQTPKVSVETLSLVVSTFAKCGYYYTQGTQLHCLAQKLGHLDDILQTSFLDFYAKYGDTQSSSQFSSKNSIHFSAMMSGFIQNGLFSKAITLFKQIQDTGQELEIKIIKNLVDAFANLGALQSGKEIHAHVIKIMIDEMDEEKVHIETSILNMYVKCGSILHARKCFNTISKKDLVTYTSMIEGYGLYGNGHESLAIYNQMLQKTEIKPNSVTFLSLLSACSHSGMVREGCEVFYSMKSQYDIEPDLDHYTSLVDLLGRSGLFKYALLVVLKMVIRPDSRIWGAIFAATRIYDEKKVADFAAKRILDLEPGNVGYYTLMSNLEASVGNWSEMEEIRRRMNDKGLRKKPGWSHVEEKGRIYGFVCGDKSHVQAKEIYESLGFLYTHIRQYK